MLSNNSISLEERTDLTESECKMWRALIRVSSLEKDKVGEITKEYIDANREILEQQKQEAKEENYEPS